MIFYTLFLMIDVNAQNFSFILILKILIIFKICHFVITLSLALIDRKKTIEINFGDVILLIFR
jgi:hypothetical protein